MCINWKGNRNSCRLANALRKLCSRLVGVFWFDIGGWGQGNVRVVLEEGRRGWLRHWGQRGTGGRFRGSDAESALTVKRRIGGVGEGEGKMGGQEVVVRRYWGLVGIAGVEVVFHRVDMESTRIYCDGGVEIDVHR